MLPGLGLPMRLDRISGLARPRLRLRRRGLYLLGRRDDVIIVDGRNHFPQDIELTAERSHEGLAPGRAAAFGYASNGGTAIAVVAETARRVRVRTRHCGEHGSGRRRRGGAGCQGGSGSPEHQIRVARVGALVAGRRAPGTTSGKARRARCRELLLADGLKTWRKRLTVAGTAVPDRLSSRSSGAWAAASEIEQWIMSRIAVVTGEQPESCDADVPDLSISGLSSHVMPWCSMAELQEYLNRPLPPTLIWDHPTPRALASHLAARCCR